MMRDSGMALQARIRALGKRIDEAEAQISMKRPLSPGHRTTNAEIRARYEGLLRDVNDSEEKDELNGRHIGDLEHSVRLWMADIDRGGT